MPGCLFDLPFLVGERLVARVGLKATRGERRLLVLAAHLTGAQGRGEAKILSQSRSAVRFKVPKQVEPGRQLLSIKTADNPPQWLEQPTSLAVRGRL